MRNLMKMLSLVLVVVMVMTTFVGCGSENTNSNPSESTNDDTPATNKPEEKLKAVLITPQKLGDAGPVDASYSALQKGGEDFDYDVKVLEPQPGEYEDSLRAMCDDGYNLIICLFSQIQDAVSRVAPEYPDVNFVQILGDLEMDNVKTCNFLNNECAYLSGILAANMTKTGKVAAIAGAPVGDNNRAIAGFEAGAREVNPDIEVNHLYVGSFEDPTKGKELANTLLSDDYDIIMHVCASSSMGIREAIKENPGTFMIGDSNDEQNAVPGQVLSSNFTSYYQFVYNSMQEVNEGSFETGVIYEGLAEGAVDCIIADESLVSVPQETRDLVEQYKQKIIDGEIDPPKVLEE